MGRRASNALHPACALLSPRDSLYVRCWSGGGFSVTGLIREMVDIHPELADTEEAGGMEERMTRLEHLVTSRSAEIGKLARSTPSQAPL